MNMRNRMLALGLAFAVAVTSFFMPVIQAEAATDTNLDVEYNYAKLLQESLYFYDANMCGYLDDECAIGWRGNCHTYDQNGQVTINGVTYPVDASGGFHDAGDHVKFGLPQGYAASMLGMSYYEFPSAFTETGQGEHLKTITDYFCDYFKRCTVYAQGSDTVVGFVYQVGEGNSDHAVWCAPESQTLSRPLYVATSENPATDEISVAVAALAINYMNFGASGEERYAQDLKAAKDLFAFMQASAKGCASEGAGDFYNSTSWQDDYALAAAALYKATGETEYLNEYNANKGGINTYWVLDWANSGAMASMLMEDTAALSTIANVIRDKTKLDNVFCCLNDWGSCRYSAAEQFVGLTYDKLTGTKNYDEWAVSQMNYMIGDNPTKQCYAVGYNANSSKYPHHRAASRSTDANVVNPDHYTLLGALVGGPKTSGYYADDQGNYENNEVALDYNAGYVGALAGLYASHRNDTSTYLSYANRSTAHYSTTLASKAELEAIGVIKYYGSSSDGDISGGNVSSGDASDGDVSGGNVSSGDASDGGVSGGNVSSGDASDGDVSGGNVSSGDASDGDISGGDSQPEICLHVSKRVERQNESDATCTEAGSYDEVTICSFCGTELGREHKTINALGHKWDAGQVITEADLNHYCVVRYTCGRCDITRDETLEDGLFHVLSIPDQLYTGKTIKPAVTVYDGSVLLRSGKDYSLSYAQNKDVGIARVTVKGKGNYKGSLITTFRIMPKNISDEDVTVQVNGVSAADLRYGITLPVNGEVQQPAFTVKWGSKRLKKDVDFTVNYPDETADDCKAAGDYQIQICGKKNGNFTGERYVSLHLTDQAITPVSKLKCTVKAQKYTGNPVTTTTAPELLTVKDGGKTLTENREFTVRYEDNTDAGTARIILTGNSEAGYSGTRELSFKIVGTPIGKASFRWLDETGFAYAGGEPVTPGFELLYDGGKLDGSSYDCKYEKNTQVGTATLILTGKGRFAGSIKKTYQVQPYDALADSQKIIRVDAIEDQIYLNSGAKPKVCVRAGETILTEGVDYTLSYKNNRAITTEQGGDRCPKVLIKFKGNYRNTVTKDFVIRKGNLQNARFEADDRAESVKPLSWKQSKIVLYDETGKKLKAGTDYSKEFVYSYDPEGKQPVESSDTVNAQTTIYVTVTGIGNYADSSITGSYRVVKTMLKAGKIKAVIANRTYQTTPQTLQASDIAVTCAGVELTPVQDYVVEETSRETFLNVGRVTVKIRGQGDYGGTCRLKYYVVAKMFE